MKRDEEGCICAYFHKGMIAKSACSDRTFVDDERAGLRVFFDMPDSVFAEQAGMKWRDSGIIADDDIVAWIAAKGDAMAHHGIGVASQRACEEPDGASVLNYLFCWQVRLLSAL